ncbi:MAG: type II toxin-antitoxin system Phd/YefM family antitoxin [Oscillospiraceae bacterium]|nr:type II toxin-antitoxin system Phd/YefM family antitoxin [Oscillospiraceae bacterium]
MTIVPVSDLRNYNKVLKQVSYGNEVALTKNGKAQYAIVDIEELERLRAERWLMSELRKSEMDIEAGRITNLEDVRKEFGL